MCACTRLLVEGADACTARADTTVIACVTGRAGVALERLPTDLVRLLELELLVLTTVVLRSVDDCAPPVAAAGAFEYQLPLVCMAHTLGL